jgi:hypothetical protein
MLWNLPFVAEIVMQLDGSQLFIDATTSGLLGTYINKCYSFVSSRWNKGRSSSAWTVNRQGTYKRRELMWICHSYCRKILTNITYYVPSSADVTTDNVTLILIYVTALFHHNETSVGVYQHHKLMWIYVTYRSFINNMN